MGRKLLLGIGLLALLVAVFWGTKKYYTLNQLNAKEQSQVLVEKIKAVAKLVTVEGHFSEVYSYEDYWQYDYSPFRKKALIRVRAKVSVGYDLKQMSIEARPEEKLVLISNLPDPEILSIDHDLDYYDITEGSFNSFSKEDYNRMNKNAKEKIREQANGGDLFIAAEKQSDNMLEMVRFMVEGAGWRLQYLPRGIQSPSDSLKQ